ncbi:hypothetical protein ACFCV3_00910 [Kribbella sp. NPDC056345]|uniref:hypothetical protein n=1 Tax=Kribbella sp. NPDC056345 TaxID=3345789 RepID=UPI0035D6582A
MKMQPTREGAAPPRMVGTSLGTDRRQVPPMDGRRAVNDGIDYTRPLLIGYILKHLLMTDGELAGIEDKLEEFAKVEGYTMGTIFKEDSSTAPAAFRAMIDHVIHYEVTTVIIPSRLHLGALDVNHDVQKTFERATGARVIVASNIP